MRAGAKRRAAIQYSLSPFRWDVANASDEILQTARSHFRCTRSVNAGLATILCGTRKAAPGAAQSAAAVRAAFVAANPHLQSATGVARGLSGNAAHLLAEAARSARTISMPSPAGTSMSPLNAVRSVSIRSASQSDLHSSRLVVTFFSAAR
jgi:hypothetical protein